MVRKVPLASKRTRSRAAESSETIISLQSLSKNGLLRSNFGSAGLIDSIVLFKDNAFLGTSAHESVPLVGYLPDCRCGSRPRETLAGSSEMALGRAGANLGRQNGAILTKNA